MIITLSISILSKEPLSPPERFDHARAQGFQRVLRFSLNSLLAAWVEVAKLASA